jgi:hypothetical protein
MGRRHGGVAARSFLTPCEQRNKHEIKRKSKVVTRVGHFGQQCGFVDPTFVGRFRAFGQAQGAQVFVCKSDGSLEAIS